MHNYVIINNVSSSNIQGLYISLLPNITKPPLRSIIENIDGVDGDVITKLGYDAYDKTLQISLLENCNINDIELYFNSEGVITFSNEPDKYYKYQILEQIDFEQILKFKTANIIIHCQPFKYKLNESSVTGNDSVSVTNYGNIKSKPLITLKGTANQTVSFYLNETQIFQYTFDSDEEVIIDCEKQDAYYNGNLKNRNMIGEFPELNVGSNTITCNNAEISILANSRWL